MSSEPVGEGQGGDGAAPHRTPIRVVIADDHALYRQSLSLVLTLDGDIDVVGEASNGLEALDLAAELQPDIVVLDLQMPRLDGINAVRSIVARVPSGHVLMLTMSEAPEDLLTALQAGANGYLLKSAPAEKVLEAVRELHVGRVVVSPSVLTSLLNDVLSRDPEFLDPRIVTDRVRILLRRMAKGASPEQIAAEDQVDEDAIRLEFGDVLQALRDAADRDATLGQGPR